MATPVFFELSWSILCTTCITNVLFGCLVCGIIDWTLIATVPVFSSAAGAVANGLCYYVYYATHPVVNRAIASVFCDTFWLLQEAGLLFYSYIILNRTLQGVRWQAFTSIFWIGVAGVVISRIAIIALRVRFILDNNGDLLALIDYIHIAYFGLIALTECLSAYFLMALFTSARASSLQANVNIGLFRYLSRSTEARVAILAVQGISQAIIHASKTAGQAAKNVATQLDRFVYAMLCLYPVVLYIDLLASKLVSGNQKHSHSRGRGQQGRFALMKRDKFVSNAAEHGVELQGGAGKTHNDSTDIIVEGGPSQNGAYMDLEDMDVQGIVIRNTVEFDIV